MHFMDVKLLHEIEKVVDFKNNITPEQIFDRLNKLDALLTKIYPQVAEASHEEKTAFMRLFTRGLDLVRMSMDIQMKAAGLSHEKLKVIFENAKHSHNPQDRVMLEVYDKLQRELRDIDIHMAKANAMASKLKAQMHHQRPR